MPDFVDAAGDERTRNNVLRHEYRLLSDAEKQTLQQVKDAGAIFLHALARIPESRETSLARTKLEEAVMWAIKGLTT